MYISGGEQLSTGQLSLLNFEVMLPSDSIVIGRLLPLFGLKTIAMLSNTFLHRQQVISIQYRQIKFRDKADIIF